MQILKFFIFINILTNIKRRKKKKQFIHTRIYIV